MPLTVAEREHWRDRISRRIDKKIAAVTARDPGLFDRVARDARIRATQSLGIAEFISEQDQLELQKKVLDARDEVLSREVLARLRGTPPNSMRRRSRFIALREFRHSPEPR